MSDRPSVTVEACTANTTNIILEDGVSIHVSKDEIIIHSNGKKITVEP